LLQRLQNTWLHLLLWIPITETVINKYIPKVNLFPVLRFLPGDVFRVQQCTDQNQMVREGIQKYIDEHIATLNEDDARDFRESSYLLSELRKMVWFIVCNGTFNNISVISWQSVLWVEETGVSGKKPPICRKSLTNCYHIMLCFADHCLPFFFWPFVSLFDLRFLITPLTSSNFSSKEYE
jgi:hypothetical protein